MLIKQQLFCSIMCKQYTTIRQSWQNKQVKYPATVSYILCTWLTYYTGHHSEQECIALHPTQFFMTTYSTPCMPCHEDLLQIRFLANKAGFISMIRTKFRTYMGSDKVRKFRFLATHFPVTQKFKLKTLNFSQKWAAIIQDIFGIRRH